MKIAINGMGRIGRLLFRRLLNHPQIELVAVNDVMSTDNLFYLLRYDSIYGTIPFDLQWDAQQQLIKGPLGKTIQVLQCPNPLDLPWNQLGVDLVLECSGMFAQGHKASAHLTAGAAHVLLSTTGDEEVPLLVYGYNHHEWNEQMKVISPGGCMTNCSVPLLDVLENALGIQSVHINFLHSYTSRQELVDAPHRDYRRGRAAAESFIPVPVDQASTLERLIPSLKGKIAATSTRIPVANGAMADFSVVVKQGISCEDLHKIIADEAAGQYDGMMSINFEPLVSLDYKGNKHSSVVDATLTQVLDNHIRLFAWFDNEYGFTSRMINWIGAIGRIDPLL